MGLRALLPNALKVPAYDPKGDTSVRRALTLLLVPGLIFYFVWEIAVGGTETAEALTVPVPQMYDTQAPPRGGILKTVADGLWTNTIPSSFGSWSGEANSLAELPLEIRVLGDAAAVATVSQQFDPYSKCTPGDSNTVYRIDTHLATGQSLEYRNDQLHAPWTKTTATVAPPDPQGHGDCAACRDSPITFVNCLACMTTVRVKLCGRNMPGPEFGNGHTHVAVKLPAANASLPLKVQLRPSVSGCFGPKGKNPCKDQPEGGGHYEWTSVTVRPNEHVGLSTELALTFESDYAVEHGGYAFNTRGSMLLHAGADVIPSPAHAGSELRITLGQISYVRRVSRISEIIGLVGGAMGIFITVLSVMAVGLEKPQVQRAVTMRRGGKTRAEKAPVESTAGDSI